MIPAVTLRIRLLSTSTRTRRRTMKKTFITFGYSLVDSNPRLHQHRRRPRLQLQRQRRRLHRRLRLHRHLPPVQRQDLLLLQGPFPRPEGDLLPGRDSELPAIGDRATASSKVDRLLLKMPVRLGPMGNQPPKAQISGGRAAFFANALRTTRSTVQGLPAVRKPNFRFIPVTKSSAQTSRQGCCSE